MKIRRFSAGIVGIVLFGMAIFAEQFGIDNDPGWGLGRWILFGSGIVLVVLNWLAVLFGAKLLKLVTPITEPFCKFTELNYSTQLNLFAFLASLTVFAVYIWFFFPFFTTPTTDYYSQLAAAFKRNQLHLLEKPPPSLMALRDPYDFESRKEIEEDFTWDVSLYKDRFYLYWGPVPALIISAFSSKQPAGIGDQYIFFAFICGLFIYAGFLMRSIWLSFNHRMPAWTIGIPLIAFGLAGPSVWMFVTPRVYEAAVVGAQLFLIGGCYWAYKAIDDTPLNLWKLTLAGIHWALAIGTRIMVLPATIFLAGLTLLYLWRERKTVASRRIFLAWLAVCLPLLMVIAGLGLYNWLRFDSIFETGFRYQLATVNYNEFSNVFSVDYINENLFNYFAHPIDIQAKFPYLRAVENTFSNARLAGLLYTSPYFVFIGIPAVYFIFSNLNSRRIFANYQDMKFPEIWLVIGLAGSAVISLSLVLSYYFPALRFAGDFLPATMLLAAVCLGRGYESFSGNRVLSRLYIFLATVLVVSSAVVSILIAIPIDRTGFILLMIKVVQQWLGLR